MFIGKEGEFHYIKINSPLIHFKKRIESKEITKVKARIFFKNPTHKIPK